MDRLHATAPEWDVQHMQRLLVQKKKEHPVLFLFTERVHVHTPGKSAITARLSFP
jgi:hypothetical protein